MYVYAEEEEDRDFDLANSEPDAPLPLTVTSRVLYMLGDITAGPAYRFAQWLELVRKRSSKYRPRASLIDLTTLRECP
ncbi:UNVERIFIED_CONTAM: Dual specificity protein phosphatase PHS1 [Sesamum calycinum]|uniref:Dual specificity protein phosphatase PHS1 n=1 Tax=Sesamum calycinum TaxID=2727403 RepID=A0AAW2NE05_9LAMI